MREAGIQPGPVSHAGNKEKRHFLFHLLFNVPCMILLLRYSGSVTVTAISRLFIAPSTMLTPFCTTVSLAEVKHPVILYLPPNR